MSPVTGNQRGLSLMDKARDFYSQDVGSIPTGRAKCWRNEQRGKK